jgi:hypothetical protein
MPSENQGEYSSEIVRGAPGKIHETESRERVCSDSGQSISKILVLIIICSEILAAAPGLPWKVAKRLKDLRFIEEDLAKNDVQEQMSNVQAIIAAYTSGELKWKRGTCTFWSNGRMVWGPGKFDWKTFSDVNKAHQGHKSFWVEEVGESIQDLSIVMNLANGLPVF